MTAHQFIDSIYSRLQTGMPGNMRFITLAQLDLLGNLLDEDQEGGAVWRGTGRSFVWAPKAGVSSSLGWKYVVTEGHGGRRNTIVRLANIVPSPAGSLFGS